MRNMQPPLRLWLKVVTTITYLFFFLVTGLALHEMGHAAMLALVGSGGAITYKFVLGVYPTVGATFPTDTLEGAAEMLVRAGGLLTVVWLLPVWLWAKLTSTVSDLNVEFASMFTIANATGYSIGEILFRSVPDSSQFTVNQATGGGFALMVSLIYLPRLVRWFFGR